MEIVIPIITLIVGLVGGFFIGVFYLRKQLEKMQSDPDALQKMAKQMGYNLNGKQMQRAQQMMKNQQPGGKMPQPQQHPARKNSAAEDNSSVFLLLYTMWFERRRSAVAGVKDYLNSKVSDNREKIEYHVEQILKLIGEDSTREGLLETPARVTRMYEEIFGGYEVDPRDVLGVTFDENHEELVIVKDIVYYSQCEHHMAPFFGKVHIGYVPSGKIVGLSKMARLVEAVTRRLQVQERITSQIADILTEAVEPHGVMVVVEGEHLCMCSRGVKKPGSKTVTSAVRGSFRENPAQRAEFLSLVKD